MDQLQAVKTILHKTYTEQGKMDVPMFSHYKKNSVLLASLLKVEQVSIQNTHLRTPGKNLSKYKR